MEIAWYFVGVPKEITDDIFSKVSLRGSGFRFLPITASLDGVTWETSLLPLGKQNYFIALKKDVRKKTGIDFGDTVTVTFQRRF